MTETIESTVNPSVDPAREIASSRVFDAPRELVFQMFTDPKHVVEWWGPRGFRNTIHSMDIRPGGSWEFIMHGPDGQDYKNKIIYQEITRPERLVYDHVTGPVFHVVTTFEALGEKTRVTMRALFETAETRDYTVREFGAIEGMNQTLERLGEKLASVAADPDTLEEFIIVRSFNVRRDVMFKLWTDPEHVKHWFGPKGSKVVHTENDFRPGGMHLYAMEAPDGSVIWGRWVYREIVPPERLVFVNSFSNKDGGVTRHPFAPGWPAEMLSTITFDEFEGKTSVAIRWLPINATEAERNHFRTNHPNMQMGWIGTLDQLAEYIERS